mmetsp:Transcript_17383/g.56889  ORF Transcript_17383/g.56889 Transcript_17383/m.56889 type:complete len:207 (-) Transcript_17383:197-817(-)
MYLQDLVPCDAAAIASILLIGGGHDGLPPRGHGEPRLGADEEELPVPAQPGHAKPHQGMHAQDAREVREATGALHAEAAHALHAEGGVGGHVRVAQGDDVACSLRERQRPRAPPPEHVVCRAGRHRWRRLHRHLDLQLPVAEPGGGLHLHDVTNNGAGPAILADAVVEFPGLCAHPLGDEAAAGAGGQLLHLALQVHLEGVMRAEK